MLSIDGIINFKLPQDERGDDGLMNFEWPQDTRGDVNVLLSFIHDGLSADLGAGGCGFRLRGAGGCGLRLRWACGYGFRFRVSAKCGRMGTGFG